MLLVTNAAGAGAQAALDSSNTVLTLRAVLDSVRKHPTSLAAESRIRAARGSRVSAGTPGNPMLSYQVDQTPFPGGQALVDMEREAMTTVTVPLEFLYQRGPRVARANADVRAAQADAVLAKQRLALDAASAYYRLSVAQAQVATTHDLLGWLDTLVTYHRSRVTEGVAAESDLIRSELERDRVSAELAMQEADLAQARATLSAFVSDVPQSATKFVVAIEDAPLLLSESGLTPVTPAGMREPPVATTSGRPTLDARPDIRAARERVTASAATVGSERTMLFRQVGATIGTMQTGHVTSMVAGFTLPLPVFDRNRGEVQRADAERDAAAYELASLQRTAEAEIAGARETARILTDRASALVRKDSSSLLAHAEESRRIALGAYREGAVPLFQVIDAARAWADARMSFYRAIAAQHQSMLALMAAQGLDLSTALLAVGPRGGCVR